MYETLPEGASVQVHMLAGSMAGVMEHCIMFPVDCVKTRMQSLACETQMVSAERQGVISSLKTIMKEEGRFRPVQGVQAMALGAGPAHALYFAVMEKMNAELLQRRNTLTFLPESARESVCDAGAGATAAVFHDAVMTPAEVVKSRMQMCCSPYKSCFNCFTTVFKQEGFGAFYRSYGTNLGMSMLTHGIHVTMYKMLQRVTNPQKEYNPMSHIASGAVAGASAALLTMPLDVCKTLLNTQEAQVLKRLNEEKVTGMYRGMMTVYKLAGIRGYFKGAYARMLYQAPATGISWLVYEFFKHYLSSREHEAMDKYDTVKDLRLNVNASNDLSDNKDDLKDETKLMDLITDIPRKVRGEVQDLCQTSSSRELVEIDTRTFPPRFRTD